MVREEFYMSTQELLTKMPKRGCLVSYGQVAVFVLVAVVVAVGSGLIGHFATVEDCDCLVEPSTTLTPELSTLPSTPQPVYKDDRLPSNLRPYHYNVEMQPHIYSDDDTNFYFNGTVQMFFSCEGATDVIKLNVLLLNYSVTDLSLVDNSEAAPTVNGMDEDNDVQILTIQLSSPLQEGQNYVLSMDYTGPLSVDMYGLYLSYYINSLNETRYLVATQFEAADARKAFPCMDEPALKSTFNITLIRKSHMTALANMPLDRSEDRGDDWMADIYDTTPVMPTYLLAMVVSDFTQINQTTTHGTTVRIWGQPELMEQGFGDYALGKAVTIEEWMVNYTEMSPGVPKMDHVAIPHFGAGAMENWGLILYREYYLLYNENETTSEGKMRIVTVVAHELGHQWFGNRVSLAFWNDIFVNEAFASFYEYFAVETAEPDWNMAEQLIDGTWFVWDMDALASSDVMYFNVTSPQQYSSIFNRQVYNKGPYVLWMLENVLTPDVYQQGLQEYLHRYNYGNAEVTDLWAVLTEAAANNTITEPDGSPLDVHDKMDPWMVQIGHPIIRVERDLTTITIVHLYQRHFLLNNRVPLTRPSPYHYTWNVPISYMMEGDDVKNRSIQLWLDRGNGTIEDTLPDGEWILLNIDRRGFYRVEYEDSLRQALISQLETNHTVIPVFNRAQFIDDLFALARSGSFNVTVALESTTYIAIEEDYLPWQATVRNLDLLTAVLSRLPVYGNFQRLARARVVPLYTRMGWDLDYTPTDIMDNLLRVLALRAACAFYHPDCIEKSSSRYQAWIQDPLSNPIHPDLRYLVFCTAVRDGTPEDFYLTLGQVDDSSVIGSRTALIQSLGCSQEPWVIESLLQMAVDNSSTLYPDRRTVFLSAAGRSVGRPLVWEYLVTNWNNTPLGSADKSAVLSEVANGFYSPYHLDQLMLFRDGLLDPADITAADSAIEKIEINKKFVEEQVPILETWLEQEINNSHI